MFLQGRLKHSWSAGDKTLLVETWQDARIKVFIDDKPKLNFINNRINGWDIGIKAKTLDYLSLHVRKFLL